MGAAIHQTQVLAALLVANVAFHLHSIEQTFEELLEETKKGVVGEDSIGSLGNNDG